MFEAECVETNRLLCATSMMCKLSALLKDQLKFGQSMTMSAMIMTESDMVMNMTEYGLRIMKFAIID